MADPVFFKSYCTCYICGARELIYQPVLQPGLSLSLSLASGQRFHGPDGLDPDKEERCPGDCPFVLVGVVCGVKLTVESGIDLQVPTPGGFT